MADHVTVTSSAELENLKSQESATRASHGEIVAGVDAGQQSWGEFPRVLTREQVAALLQVQPRQLELVGVPCLNLGHKTKRYFAKDVEAWLEAQRRPFRRAA